MLFDESARGDDETPRRFVGDGTRRVGARVGVGWRAFTIAAAGDGAATASAIIIDTAAAAAAGTSLARTVTTGLIGAAIHTAAVPKHMRVLRRAQQVQCVFECRQSVRSDRSRQRQVEIALRVQLPPQQAREYHGARLAGGGCAGVCETDGILDFGFWILDFEILDFRFWNLDVGYRMLDFDGGCWVLDIGF
jgi:hypothetical protein